MAVSLFHQGANLDRARIAELTGGPAPAFFRRGGSGAGRELLTDEEFARYLERAATLAPADLLTWLHR